MLKSTVKDAQDAFAAARNLNAALKNLLKKESSNTPQIAAFAKDFRSAVMSGKSAPRDLFIERNYPAKEFYFLGAVRYACPEIVENTVGSNVNKYADDFNQTYERSDDGVKVVNTSRFAEIVKDVHLMVKNDLNAAELPVNNFMQNAILATVFEFDVLSEVMKVLE